MYEVIALISLSWAAELQHAIEWEKARHSLDMPRIVKIVNSLSDSPSIELRRTCSWHPVQRRPWAGWTQLYSPYIFYSYLSRPAPRERHGCWMPSDYNDNMPLNSKDYKTIAITTTSLINCMKLRTYLSASIIRNSLVKILMSQRYCLQQVLDM